MSLYPASILSYYPTYSILDEILSYGNYNQINIFVDLKNSLQSLYLEHAVVTIVEESIKSRFIDTSIFSSVISFLSFHKLYSIKRNIKINFYIFFETGPSYYHLNIDSRYKKNRKIDELFGLDKEKREKFFEIVQKNLMLVEKACNKIPNVKVIRMQNFEADFIPYYILRNNLIHLDNQTANIIYSADHDMYQNVQHDNCFIYVKHYKYKKIIKKGEILKNYLKVETNFNDEYYSLVMAVVGDTGDNVFGIKGIGQKIIATILDELIYMTGGMDLLYNNTFNSKPIFINQPRNPNKYLDLIIEEESKNKTISNNLKLVSFEMISRFMDNPSDTEIIKKKQYLLDILNTENKVPYKAIAQSLESVGVMLENDALENIYYEPQRNESSSL